MAGTPASAAPVHLHFSVAGVEPVAQGSMRAPAAGVVVHNDGRKLRGWRELVTAAAREACRGRKPWTGPVQLKLTFAFRQPRDRRGLQLKFTKPDIDKLERAVLDALTGVLYQDDAQVYAVEKIKLWQAQDGAGLAVEAWLQHEEPAP